MNATGITILYHLIVNNSIREIELLAPARDAAVAKAAIDHGADAVYMGAEILGARKSAANSLADIASVVGYAHKFGAKVYVTVNTIIYEHELESARQLAWDLWRTGVDALIVQDMALLQMDMPPIALHASTQCDTRTPAKARMLADAGFSQIVLARELSLEEIAEICRETDIPVEVFVHGALCVSYSGDCQASWAITHRSANRGECAQVCRMAFDLEDNRGNKIIKGKHLMSLRDLNRIADLGALLDAGVSSFKIEGRLKDTAYVKNVVAAYRAALDKLIDANPGKYKRASAGRISTAFIPDLEKSFNRTYTTYFLNGAPATMANFDTPKWVGEYIGTVEKSGRKFIDANLDCKVENGDGLGFFNASGTFEGFRVNRAEGNRLFPAREIVIKAGTRLFRNNDVAWNKVLAADTARRVIDISLTLRRTAWGICLDGEDETGVKVTASSPLEHTVANTPQEASRERVLMKTGATIFNVAAIADHAGDMFIPASVLTGLRRDTLALLEKARELGYHTPKAGRSTHKFEIDKVLTRHDNVANTAAMEFYRHHGAAVSEQAIEVAAPEEKKEIRVMECRYCLRRELGACMKSQGKDRLPRQLFLTTANHHFRLEFDCKACRMRLWYQV